MNTDDPCPGSTEGLSGRNSLKVTSAACVTKAISVFVMRGPHETLINVGPWNTHTPWHFGRNACCTHPFWDESGPQPAPNALDEELGSQGFD